jgi:hypothetical protein
VGRLLDESTNPVDDFRRAMAVLDDQRGRLSGLLQVVSSEPIQTGIGIIHNGGKRLASAISLVRGLRSPGRFELLVSSPSK